MAMNENIPLSGRSALDLKAVLVLRITFQVKWSKSAQDSENQ